MLMGVCGWLSEGVALQEVVVVVVIMIVIGGADKNCTSL